MDLRQLRYFVNVAKYLDFTEAAQHLYMRETVLTKQIKNLEERSGAILFTRNKNSVQLTDAGKLLLVKAKERITEADEARRLAQLNTDGHNKLKIGFLLAQSRKTLPPILERFNKKYPGVLQIEQKSWKQIYEGLGSGDIDIGVTTSYGLKKIKGIVWRKLFTDFIYAVVRADHPLANERSIVLAALAHEPFITLCPEESPGEYNQALRLCAEWGFTPNIISQPQLLEPILLMVQAGMGVALLPHSAEAFAFSDLRFIQLENEQVFMDVVFAHNEDNPNPMIPLFLQESGITG